MKLNIVNLRRIDASLWVTGADDVTYPGIAASYAAGVVRCDLRRGAAEVVEARIARGLFTACPDASDLATSSGRYVAHQVSGDDPGRLVAGVQARMDDLEAGAATHARTGDDPPAGGDAPAPGGDDLLVVDGPLRRSRLRLPRTLGYVKTHPTGYLPPPLSTVVASLRPGERTPIFGMGTRWPRYAWYLRLPGPAGGPWSGVVRAECAEDAPVAAATALADLSTVALPRFASTEYKDPRAPQNLVPIAGLERRLRALLGDARLLHRALVRAAHRPGSAAVS